MTEQLLFRGGVYQSANKSTEFLVFFNMKLILYLLISHLYTTAWGLFSVRVMHALFIMINLFMVIHLSVQKKRKENIYMHMDLLINSTLLSLLYRAAPALPF